MPISSSPSALIPSISPFHSLHVLPPSRPLRHQPHPMTLPASPSPLPPAPADGLDLLLGHLLPAVLAAALAAKAFATRWRRLHADLLLLQSSLSDLAALHLPPATLSHHPLLLPLLPSLLSSLRGLLALSARCLDPSLPSGRLLLQSDLDIAASSLSLHLHDLSFLLCSGVLSSSPSTAPTAAIVLPLPGPSASRADLALFVRDAFARLHIGGFDLKLKALDSLIDLLHSDTPKLAHVVAADGDIPALLRLLDPPAHSLLRDRAASAACLLVSASAASRRSVFDQGGLGPLLRLFDSGSAAVRERAAVAVEAITADPACAWAVPAYGGVPILINACRPGSGSPAVQTLAVASLKNIASTDDVRAAIAEEGAVPVFTDLLTSGTSDAKKNAALCLWSLASMGGADTRSAIIREAGLQRLLQSLREASDQEVQESILKVIHALSAHPAAAKTLSSSPAFFAYLSELVRHGSTFSQCTAAALVGELSPGDVIKRSMASCMVSLVKMMETSKPTSMQETAARALVALVAVKPNRKELVRDEKSLTRLVQMLDPGNEVVEKSSPVAVVLALTAAGGKGTRRRLAQAGACQFLQKLADAEVAGAKKALQRIAGNRLKSLLSMGRNTYS